MFRAVLFPELYPLLSEFTFQLTLFFSARNFTSLPLTWSSSELALVQDLNVGIVIAHRVLDVCLAYCHFVEHNLLPSTSFPDFLWAMCVVSLMRIGRVLFLV
jgi:hypothetical protein